MKKSSDDSSAKIWDVATGQELFTLTGHTSGVLGIAFSSDGTRLATAGYDNTAKVWDAATGQELFTLIGHTGRVWNVAFSPKCVSPSEVVTEHCETYLASASADGTVKVWDAITGQEQFDLLGDGTPLDGVAISLDGRYLATSDDNGTVRVYVLPFEEVITLARSRVTRTWTIEECQRFLRQWAWP